jgi:phage repressor protein C with HTH and peptisase S24 domain
MNDEELRARVEARLLELDRSPITAANIGGLERSYIRDFVSGKKRSIKASAYSQVAAGLDWTLDDLLNRHPQIEGIGPTQEVSPGPAIGSLDRGAPDVPVLGVSLGGDATDDRGVDFWLNGETTYRVRRPRGLIGYEDLFSLVARGTSMVPKYEEGDPLFCTKMAPKIGDYVVIELKAATEAGPFPSFLKRLVSYNGSYITVEQFNPPKKLEFSRAEIRNLFRVIPEREWLG